MVPEHIQDIDAYFDEIAKEPGFLLINPLQTDVLQKKFLVQKKDPVFSYANRPVERYTDIKEKLASFPLKNKPIDKLYREKMEEMIKKCELYAAIGTDSFPQRARALWGVPSKKIIDYAYRLLSLPEAAPQKKISAATSVHLLRKTLHAYHLHKKWKIRRLDLVASAYVKQEERIVAIKKKERFSRQFIERLMVHEIGTHVLRFENGARQPYRILKSGLGHYLSTEEGLAVYNEQQNKVLSSTTLRQYAGRVIAVDLAFRHSFTELVLELKRNFKERAACKLALRVKRGLADSATPGACTKDHLYLKGYLAVKEYMENDGVYEDLYLGKIGLEHIPILKKMPEIRPPTFIPHDLAQSSIHEFVPFVPLKERK